ncbi:MAG: Lsr2 family protein [Actinobacteria bacterium]|uniref:histone-like nucleoid-structuring protein Lsr2 n=1 Tax=Propionicimonas sp. T2.31MG-18 TaxID=3157620 RepID=UPI00367348AC|nr:Lsr2 family protein [Actinomycetota bacterium]MCA0434946.1 Lsr2 family protein [Actinomycetota bacterium]
MAKRVQVIHTDDIDGSEAAETIAFALDGINYSIDLSTENAKKLRDAFAPFIAAGERDRNSSARRAGSSRRKSSGTAATDIRAWAAAQGMQVSARGRVSAEVREAYERAHS